MLTHVQACKGVDGLDLLCFDHHSESDVDVVFDKKRDFSQLFAQNVAFL